MMEKILFNEKCENCEHCYRLKHNFKVGVGYEDSYCCVVLFRIIEEPDKIDIPPFVVEVTLDSKCEMFSYNGINNKE